MADYILLASSTKIYPEEFRSPYIIHDESSLDELMDNPITADFLENNCTSLSAAKHSSTKRRIDRTNIKHSSIPGMQELWDIIDKLRSIPNPTYKQKRLLVDLYKQQYSLLETIAPTQFQPLLRHTIPEQYSLPEQFFEKICEPSYMARCLIYLPSLYYLHQQNDDIATLYEDISSSLSKITLSPLQQDILYLYQSNTPTPQCISYIQSKYNRKLTQSYLSIILYKQIAPKVADEYSNIYYSRKYANDPSKWRICLCCKKPKLLTKHNWYHFSNKPQGFSLVCKECTNKKRKY